MTLTIAICEDVPAEREYISKLLQAWVLQGGHTLHLAAFPTAERFFSAYEDGFRPDLMLLDVEMPGQTGMELAKRLRQLRDDTPIVFITGYSDYMAEGYEVSALHYLLKPVSAQALERVLSRAVEQLRHQRKFMLCNMDGLPRKVYFDEIQYVEVLSHTATVHLDGGAELSLHQTIRELEQQLGGGFCRCHRSFLVNISRIRQLQKTDILLDSGLKIPMSRRLAPAVGQAFFTYYREVAEQC